MATCAKTQIDCELTNIQELEKVRTDINAVANGFTNTITNAKTVKTHVYINRNLKPKTRSRRKSSKVRVSIEKDVQNGKIPNPVFTTYTGMQLFKEIIGPKHKIVQKLKLHLTNACENSVVQVKFYNAQGKIAVFASSSKYHSIIENTIKEVLSPLKDFFASEEVEEPIATETNAVRALLGAGCVVKRIYMPEEYRTVVIHSAIKKVSSLTKDDIRTYFEQFGHVQGCIKSKYCRKYPTVWGQITFVTSESAIEAVSSSKDNTDIYARPSVCESKSEDKFRTKITCRRKKSKGFGFVDLIKTEHLAVVVSLGSILVDGSCARVSLSKNNSNQVFVGKFNTSVTEDVLRQSVANAAKLHPENDLGKVVIVREKVMTENDLLDRQKCSLRQEIEKYAPEERTRLEFRIPRDWDINFTAYVSFQDPEEGYRACKEMNRKFMLNGEVISMNPILKTSVSVQKRIYDIIEGEIKECIKFIEETSNVKIKIKEIPNGNFIIDLHSDCVENLARAKSMIHGVVKGDIIDSNSTHMLHHLFTHKGRKKLEYILICTKTLIVIDDRKMAVFVFGNQNNRQRALADINSYLKELSFGGQELIDLKGAGKPPGTMIRLMNTFDSDLSEFVAQSQLASIEINQRYHLLKMVGTEDALQRGFDIIDNIATELLDSETTMFGVNKPYCVLCCCTIHNELYRLECCGHHYCTECLQRQVEISITDRQFPLICGYRDCELAWVWRDIQSVLNMGFVSVGDLVSASVSSFVSQNKDFYRYCISLECPMIYRVSIDGQVFQCPVCQIRVCTTCHIESHDGLTCVMYKKYERE